MRVLRLGPTGGLVKVGNRTPPGQAAVDADHRRVVAVDKDLRQTARPCVAEITVGNTKLLGQVLSNIDVGGRVAIPHDAEAQLHDQRGAEDVGKREAGTLISRGPGRIEPAVGRPTVDPQAGPVQAWIGHGRLLIAVAKEHAVIGSD